jgi:hypothetical protein
MTGTLFDHLASTRISETIILRNLIVAALRRYYADHQRFPNSIDYLSPSYLASIPRHIWGLRKWQYRSSGQEFELVVDESANAGDGNPHWLRYLGKDLGWQMRG